MPCQYEATDAGFRCQFCGDERPQPVRRRCPVAGDPEPLRMPHNRKFRTPQAVEALVGRYCRPCDAYPCLAEKNCMHADALMMNGACPRGNFTNKPSWVTNAERVTATLRLAAMVPPDVKAVAGVPRSGMMPAGILAETLHVPLYSVHHTDGLRQLAHGARLADRNGRKGRLLVVDDTIASGVSMEKLRAAMPDILAGHHFHTDVYFAAVYANPDRAELADFVAELLPLPHCLEWNLFNSIHTPTLALDIDGVIFHEERGLAGLPKYVPRNVSVPLIATGRHERDRTITEEQLHRVGARYDRLVMAATDEEYNDPATVKARAYAETPAATLFVESCPLQSRQIAEASGKRVICPATADVFDGTEPRKPPPPPTELVLDTAAPHLNPEYTSNDPWRWVTTSQLIEATSKIVPQIPPVLAGIVGIPRSGMIPASVLATWLHLPLYELSDIGPRRLHHGWRGSHIEAPADAPFLVVDDTVYNGYAMRAARSRMDGRPAIYASVFVRPAQAHHVDIYAEILPSPHLLQWNLMNSDMITGRVQNPRLHGGFALDMDGVICESNSVGDDDPGYDSWLRNAPPLWLPRFVPAPLIITYRCEKHRAVTEEWLRRWVCKWDRLVMAPFDDWRERDWSLSPVDFKARHLAESPCVGLVESHDWIARGVHEATGKVVIAVETGTVYQ